MDAALADAQDALAYKVGRFRDRLATASGLSGRQRSLEDLLADLAALGFDAMPGVRKRPVMTQLAELLGLRIEDIDVRHRCLAPVRRHGIATEQVDPAAHALGRPGQARGAGAVDLPPPVRLHVVAEGASVNARIQARRVESQKAEELIAPAGGDRRGRTPPGPSDRPLGRGRC